MYVTRGVCNDSSSCNDHSVRICLVSSRISYEQRKVIKETKTLSRGKSRNVYSLQTKSSEHNLSNLTITVAVCQYVM